MGDNNTQSTRTDGRIEVGSGGVRLGRRAAMKAAAVGVGLGGSLGSVTASSGSTGANGLSDDTHTLMLAANGPLEYEFTVDGALEADTEGGDFSADGDDRVRDAEGPFIETRDTTGPVPENAGGTTYLGDRFRFFYYMPEFEVETDSGYDVNVYYNGSLVAPEDVPEVDTDDGERNLLTIAANGPTEYYIRAEGELSPDTEGGDFSADSDDEVTENDDGTLTAADETGPVSEDAGEKRYLGDRYLFSGTVEELTLDLRDSSHDAEVYLDEEPVSASTVRNRL